MQIPEEWRHNTENMQVGDLIVFKPEEEFKKYEFSTSRLSFRTDDIYRITKVGEFGPEVDHNDPRKIWGCFTKYIETIIPKIKKKDWLSLLK